jgi:hypothetical protein
MAERSGESANDASDTNNTSRTQRQPQKRPNVATNNGEAVSATARQANARQARGGQEQQAGAAGKDCGASAGAGALQAVQDRMGRDCGADSERARYALRVSVLPEITPGAWSGTRVQKDAASAMGPLAPRGGIRNRWHAH